MSSLKKTNLEKKLEEKQTTFLDEMPSPGRSVLAGAVVPAVLSANGSCVPMVPDSRVSSLESSVSGPGPTASAVPCPTCGIPFAWQTVYDLDGSELKCWECQPPPAVSLIKAGWIITLVDGNRNKPTWELMERQEWPRVMGRPSYVGAANG